MCLEALLGYVCAGLRDVRLQLSMEFNARLTAGILLASRYARVHAFQYWC